MTEKGTKGIRLNNSFMDSVNFLQEYLIQKKDELSKCEEMLTDETKIEDYLLNERISLFDKLDEHFKQMWGAIRKMSPPEYKYHQEYMQKSLLPLLQDSIEINTQIFTKPLGYSGDFKVMNYIYDYSGTNTFLGGDLYEKLINNYTCNIPISKSNIERKEFLKKKIKAYVKARKSDLSILSIGGGSLRELTEFLQQNKLEHPINFTSIDFEPRAMKYVKKEVEKLPVENKEKINIAFIQKDVKEIIRQKQFNIDEQDLVYSAGITDYLGERVSKNFVRRFLNLVKEGGELIVCNIAPVDNEHRPYYETLGGWKMKHREKEDLLSWADGLGEVESASVDPVGRIGGYLKLHIHK